MKPTLLILAAGVGSRYGGLKQMDPIGPSGEAIIDYSIFDAIRAGFGKVVFVIRKSIEKDFLEVFKERFLKHIDYELAYQELDILPEGIVCPPDRVKPWGTGHAIWVARNLINEPFVAINADDFYGRDAYQVLSDFLKANPQPNTSGFAMCGYHVSNTLSDHGGVARGVCQINQDGYLESVQEQFNIEKQADGTITSTYNNKPQTVNPKAIVSMNIWGFNPSIFSVIEDYFTDFFANHLHEPKSEVFIPTVVDEMIQKGQGRVSVLQSEAKWFGVTFREDKPAVIENLQNLIKKGEYPENLWV